MSQVHQDNLEILLANNNQGWNSLTNMKKKEMNLVKISKIITTLQVTITKEEAEEEEVLPRE